MTPAVRLTLAAVAAASTRLGYPPTLREVGEARRPPASVATVHAHLHRLRRAGMVEWQQGAARTLRVTVKGREVLA